MKKIVYPRANIELLDLMKFIESNAEKKFVLPKNPLPLSAD